MSEERIPSDQDDEDDEDDLDQVGEENGEEEMHHEKVGIHNTDERIDVEDEKDDDETEHDDNGEEKDENEEANHEQDGEIDKEDDLPGEEAKEESDSVKGVIQMYPTSKGSEEAPDDDVAEELLREAPEAPLDPEIAKQQEMVDNTPRTTELEHALYECLMRKESQVKRLTGEITKLKAFISKRKQTYKRKRKDEGAPTRALSAYNIFVQDRFSKLAKENEQALKSSDSDAQLKRVPPASLVASTGNQWKELSAEEKMAYEERAREDRKRYEEQMAKYQPPDKQANRKRNKTGYNMFFSAHVLRLKQSESGVPSERGSVARLVGNAWKQLSAEEKQYYEREADKMNGMNPVDKDDDDDDGDDKRPQMPDYPPNYPPPHADMHMHPGMPPPMHGHPQHAAQHDPRHAYHYPPNYAYPPPPYHGYHEPPSVPGQHRHYQSRSHYQYNPPHPAYDQRGMGM